MIDCRDCSLQMPCPNCLPKVSLQDGKYFYNIRLMRFTGICNYNCYNRPFYPRITQQELIAELKKNNFDATRIGIYTEIGSNKDYIPFDHTFVQIDKPCYNLAKISTLYPFIDISIDGINLWLKCKCEECGLLVTFCVSGD